MAGGNVSSIKDALRDAPVAPDMRDPDAGSRKRGGGERTSLWADAPITVLGKQGMTLWVLDNSNQLVNLKPRELGKGELILLFGDDEWMIEQCPAYSKPAKDKPSEVIGFNQADVQRIMMIEANRQDIFSPQGRVFGRGAHRAKDDHGKLVLHLGKRVLIAGAADKRGLRTAEVSDHPAGKIDRSFYPAADALPPPASAPSSDDEARALLTLFGDWKWVEPAAAPILLLGMSAQMHICGALDWRSHVWLAGPTAAGKTSLQRVLRAIHGGWCIQVADASEAAVRQKLNDDTLPVMLDEAEADDNPEKQRAIVNLAKKSSSGDKIIRGGADHKATEFTAQSCFLFSSVLHSLAKGEERNRVAVLDMKQIDLGDGEWEPPDLDHWRDVGRRMHRRMIEQWPRWEDTLADYKKAIFDHGIEGRWQDTYGTLLACADMLLHHGAPRHESELNPEHGREKRYVLRVLPLMTRTRAEARTDVENCLSWLQSRLLPGAHGAAPEPVGVWINRAMTLVDDSDGGGGPNETARAKLRSYGLRVVELVPDKGKASGFRIEEPPPRGPAGSDGANAYLAVAYGSNGPLSELFRGTGWAGGTWIQSIGKIDGAVKGLKLRFVVNGNSENAIAVPLRALRGEES